VTRNGQPPPPPFFVESTLDIGPLMAAAGEAVLDEYRNAEDAALRDGRPHDARHVAVVVVEEEEEDDDDDDDDAGTRALAARARQASIFARRMRRRGRKRARIRDDDARGLVATVLRGGEGVVMVPKDTLRFFFSRRILFFHFISWCGCFRWRRRVVEK
jgi:hypothetical protein